MAVRLMARILRAFPDAFPAGRGWLLKAADHRPSLA